MHKEVLRGYEEIQFNESLEIQFNPKLRFPQGSPEINAQVFTNFPPGFLLCLPSFTSGSQQVHLRFMPRFSPGSLHVLPMFFPGSLDPPGFLRV
ncbi:uncharacterized [Tachysurus ichikawai]